MLALTGIAMSSFLAMVFSMMEPRVSAALNLRNRGDFAHDSMAGRKGRVMAPVYLPSDLTPAFRAVKPWMVPFPAVIGLGVFGASLWRRSYRLRRFRAAWELCRTAGVGPALRRQPEEEPAAREPGESIGLAEQGSIHRAA